MVCFAPALLYDTTKIDSPACTPGQSSGRLSAGQTSISPTARRFIAGPRAD